LIPAGGSILGIDWITWGLFAIGLIILVAWMILPIREFRELKKKHSRK